MSSQSEEKVSIQAQLEGAISLRDMYIKVLAKFKTSSSEYKEHIHLVEAESKEITKLREQLKGIE